jgi:signal transduction histidine kinase
VGLPVAAAALAILAGFSTHGAAVGAYAVRTVPEPSSRPLALVLVAVATGLLASAALRLAPRRRQAEADPTGPILAGGVLMLAVAGLYEVVLGVGGARGISLSELPRAIGFSLILLAAVGYEPQARARLAKAAALAERRRIAQDLHDGLAQDLAFIAAHAPSLVEEMGEEHPIVIAAGRALAISRATINHLSDPAGASAGESLEAVAQELRERFDIAIAVDVQLADDLDPQAREHVTRISREAIANAARHGGARNVSVSLRRLELAVVLRVVDDGSGLTGADGDAAPEGFGLESMRERAAALGGYLSLHRPQRGGTELEVVFR